ncbi:hypothetical protein [Candidatus Macondimonas diazotrophica]|jgi:hypothetical protein|uniref:Uncharacterized protein n=1 Tax=Candidatus Macondimonas diazotrophica TaxID=2305248 RepID=A0A4Z0F7P9_9GAMM|nr:hypothetical protein [Candidatus Macondimonas diazotrophica]TFZ81478.1 hypothetical protein E4680_12420 [Candidatus Macondimonas diazotrophica]
MNVSEAIELLKNAELNQLHVKDDKNAVLGFINLGILEIHKRFRLLGGEALVTLRSGKKEYVLDGEDIDVAIDLDGHDILDIEDIIEEADGEEQLTHLMDSKEGIQVSQYNRIKVDSPEEGKSLLVTYRAAPSFLVHEKQQIPLPPQFIEALFHYVGYRGHGAISGELNKENNSHYQRFDRSCHNIKSNGLYNANSLSSDKFTMRGFV